MHTIVCVKEISDPEAPSEYFKVDSENKRVIVDRSVNKVISPFDEQAVEAALRIKDKWGGKVTILCLGNRLDRATVKKPLFMGADELYLLEDAVFISGDSWTTSYALSQAIQKIGAFDLVLCGRQSGDLSDGQVPLGLAEMLRLPCVTIARKIDISNEKVIVERVSEDGYHVVEVGLPALITVSNEIGEARYPSIEGIRKSAEIHPIILKPGDIGADLSKIGANGRRLNLERLYEPFHEVVCEIIEGETLEEAAQNLALRLKETKVI